MVKKRFSSPSDCKPSTVNCQLSTVNCLPKLFGVSQNRIDIKPVILAVTVFKHPETAQQDLVFSFPSHSFGSGYLAQQFPLIGFDRQSKLVAALDDHSFQSFPRQRRVLFLQTAIQQLQQIADMTAADSTQAIESFGRVENFANQSIALLRMPPSEKPAPEPSAAAIPHPQSTQNRRSTAPAPSAKPSDLHQIDWSTGPNR